MSQDYVRSISTHLSGYYHENRLKREIGAWTVPIGTIHLMEIVVNGDDITFTFNRAFDGSEETEFDAILTDHPTAAKAKVFRVTVLDGEVRLFIENRYPAHRQRTLTYLRQRADAEGLTNRRDYIDTLWAWIDSVIAHFYTKRDEVEAQTTAPDVDAVDAALTPFEATDPDVSIEAARAIPD